MRNAFNKMFAKGPVSINEYMAERSKSARILENTIVHAELYLFAKKKNMDHVLDYITPILIDSLEFEWGKNAVAKLSDETVEVSCAATGKNIVFYLDKEDKIKSK